jgi:hypothetical protein
MIEVQDARVSCRQLFVEVPNPVLLDASLLRSQAGGRLRPLGSSLGRGRVVIAFSCRVNEPSLS